MRLGAHSRVYCRMQPACVSAPRVHREPIRVPKYFPNWFPGATFGAARADLLPPACGSLGRRMRGTRLQRRLDQGARADCRQGARNAVQQSCTPASGRITLAPCPLTGSGRQARYQIDRHGLVVRSAAHRRRRHAEAGPSAGGIPSRLVAGLGCIRRRHRVDAASSGSVHVRGNG